MTQDERWLKRYNEVFTFIETDNRTFSKYAPIESDMYNYIKHTKKQLNQVILKVERIEKFNHL